MTEPYAPPVVDKDLSAITAMKESFSLVRADLGLVLLTLVTMFAHSCRSLAWR